MQTPWGRSDHQEMVVPGVTAVSTPSHGGFKLSPAREADLDARLREHGLTAERARMGYEPGWYEEDCSALAVMFAFPQTRGPETTAEECLERLRYWIAK